MASRFWSSIWTGSDGSAATEVASFFMVPSAVCHALPGAACALDGVRMLPPALATRVLNQTVTPSYCAPWFSSCSASLIISSQVLGGFGTRSERYHSSWVLLL